MYIRLFQKEDLPQVMDIWNLSVTEGEVVYYPIDQAYFEKKFLADPNYDEAFSFVALEGNEVIGFISGIEKKVFLPGQNNENTPGYITCFFVKKQYRGQEIGRKLVQTLSQAFKKTGKKTVSVSSGNPINLDWRIPGTPGHDHNNAPGMDEGCAGYGFLEHLGFVSRHREVAMYLNLDDYRQRSQIAQRKKELEEDGILIGRYDPSLDYEYDGMFDRLQSEYWRAALKTEIECHRQNKPCTDIRFIPNGKIPAGPRPILAGMHRKHLVAFTGPVDIQQSGRGWFSGICTDPNYGGRGIAGVLFDELMQEFIKIGATFSTLFTGVENHAQKIYLNAGFKVVRTFALMEKEL